VTNKQFKIKIKEIMLELLKDYDLEEITTTGNIDGYSTPFAFVGKSKKGKKKRKRISTNSTGYAVVNEELSQQDVTQVKKIIKGILNDMFRDIWLKRNAWNRI
tara:strand:+ start:224 stop:532 length:309 start_codon:yes stop_codon:yes gene_type:complete